MATTTENVELTTILTNSMRQSSKPLAEIEKQEPVEEGICPERTLWTRIWQGTAIASLVLNVVAMALSDSSNAAVIVMGIIACLIAPVVFFRQFTIQNMDSMRQEQNKLRQEVNRLQVINEGMKGNVSRLEVQVGKLKEDEVKLTKITNDQGTNVNEFVNLVKENRETLEQMKANVKANAMQSIVQGILSSDLDANAKFSEQELPLLEINIISGVKSLKGIACDREKLKAALKASDRSIESVLAMVSEIDNPTVPPEHRIFTFDEDSVIKGQHVKKVV